MISEDFIGGIAITIISIMLLYVIKMGIMDIWLKPFIEETIKEYTESFWFRIEIERRIEKYMEEHNQ